MCEKQNESTFHPSREYLAKTTEACCGGTLGSNFGSPLKFVANRRESADMDDLRGMYQRMATNLSQLVQDLSAMLARTETYYSAKLDQVHAKMEQERHDMTLTMEQGYEQAYQMIVELQNRFNAMKDRCCPNCGNRVGDWIDLPVNVKQEKAEKYEEVCEKDCSGFYQSPKKKSARKCCGEKEDCR